MFLPFAKLFAKTGGEKLYANAKHRGTNSLSGRNWLLVMLVG